MWCFFRTAYRFETRAPPAALRLTSLSLRGRPVPALADDTWPGDLPPPRARPPARSRAWPTSPATRRSLLAATLARLAGEMFPVAAVLLVLDRTGRPGLARRQWWQRPPCPRS